MTLCVVRNLDGDGALGAMVRLSLSREDLLVNLFKHLEDYGYGEVHVKRDAASGLQAIVAIHDTRLGPALGGCRFIHYETDEAAFVDALRLARGMTYKSTLAGIPLGGGKAVIMRPRGEFDREALFRAFGQFVEHLGGRYITAEDSGTTLEDMHVVRSVTKHVTGVGKEHGGSGDPSPFTALGVRRGIEACVKLALGRDSLEGVHVAVQGVGNVGYSLCRQLHELGAKLTVADIDPKRTERVRQELGASVVSLDEIFAVDCDVFAPCALGGVINDETLPQLRCKVVAGAANNQLAEPRHGVALMERGIIYAPDYVINAGGLINVAEEQAGYDPERARARTMKIYDTMYEIGERAQKVMAPTSVVADMIVEERLAAVGT